MIGFGIIPSSPKNVNHQINNLFDTLLDSVDTGLPIVDGNGNQQLLNVEQTLNGFAPKADTCGRYFDITRFIPLWVVYEKNDDPEKANAISVFDFLQKYYDWLYCDAPSGANYLLTENLLNQIDIERTRKQFYKSYIYTFLSGLDENIMVDNGGAVTPTALVNFIKNIRKNFYHKKTTLDGIRYFFKVLFSINEEEIYIYETKESILRLNGGRFANDNFAFSGSTGSYSQELNLAGSYLNNARLHDNDWIHEYSYLLSVGISASQYADYYLESAHPTGLRIVFEKRITDFVGVDDEETENTTCEYPKLSNYSPYKINTSYTTQIGTWTETGDPLYGITACVGCSGAYVGFTGPTHYFPNWIGTIDQTKFNDINIFDFFVLCGEVGITSPNDALTCTGC